MLISLLCESRLLNLAFCETMKSYSQRKKGTGLDVAIHMTSFEYQSECIISGYSCYSFPTFADDIYSSCGGITDLT